LDAGGKSHSGGPDGELAGGNGSGGDVNEPGGGGNEPGGGGNEPGGGTGVWDGWDWGLGSPFAASSEELRCRPFVRSWPGGSPPMRCPQTSQKLSLAES
jgi:hypothetical protein